MAPVEKRTCRSCGSEKLADQFTTYGTLCMTCKEQRAFTSREKKKARNSWHNLSPEQKAQRTANMVAYQKRKRAEKGYTGKGNRKLTPEQVRWVRQNYVYGDGKKIADMFDMSQAQVSMVVRGITYKNVPMEETVE